MKHSSQLLVTIIALLAFGYCQQPSQAAGNAAKPPYRTIHVRTLAVDLTHEQMEQVIAQHPGFIRLDIKIAPDRNNSDLDLLVRQFSSSRAWTYELTEVASGKNLAYGRIRADNGNLAADDIANQIAAALQADMGQKKQK